MRFLILILLLLTSCYTKLEQMEVSRDSAEPYNEYEIQPGSNVIIIETEELSFEEHKSNVKQAQISICHTDEEEGMIGFQISDHILQATDVRNVYGEIYIKAPDQLKTAMIYTDEAVIMRTPGSNQSSSGRTWHPAHTTSYQSELQTQVFNVGVEYYLKNIPHDRMSFEKGLDFKPKEISVPCEKPGLLREYLQNPS